MSCCQCPKSENGYWMISCCKGECKRCKEPSIAIPNLESKQEVTYYQYEVTHTPYASKKDGQEKIYVKTERVKHRIDILTLY